MAKSKYAPALFEVIGKKDEKPSGGLSLPKWWQSKAKTVSPAQSAQSGPQEQPASPAPQAGLSSQTADSSATTTEPSSPGAVPAAEATSAIQTTATPSVPVTGAASPSPAPVARSGQDYTDEAPRARIRDGRVELSLNFTNVSIVAGVLVLSLFLVYELGKGLSSSAKSGPPASEQAGDLEQVRNTSPDPTVLNTTPSPTERPSPRSAGSGSGATGGSATRTKANTPVAPAPSPAARPTAPPAAAPAAPANFQRTAGLSYVIIEGAIKREHKEEAERICGWLSKNNVSTTLEPAGERFQIVSTQGFDYNKEKAKCDEFCALIQNLGRKYKDEFKSAAQYDMHAPYAKKFNPK